MGFFDDLGKKISDVSQGAVAKGKELADIAKLNSSIAEEERHIKEAYIEIGKAYFEKHANDCDSEFAASITQIETSLDKIKDLRAQIVEIKGVTTCSNCGAEVPKNSAFCPACGSKVDPTPVADATVVETPAEEAPVEAAPAEEAPAAEAAAEETTTEQ